MRRRLCEIGYCLLLLRYAAWAAGLIYVGLLVFLLATSARSGGIDKRAVEGVTEFAVFIVPALCAVQSAAYFGNAHGRMRLEWRQVSLARQLVHVIVATVIIFLVASIAFRAVSLATSNLFPASQYRSDYHLWQDQPAIYFLLHAVFALLVALAIFFAAVFFGSSFRHPVIALGYLGITGFALRSAWSFLCSYEYTSDFVRLNVITGLALLVALPILFAIPVLLTAIQRASDGWRKTLVVLIPLSAAIVCLSLSMQWLHQRSLTIFSSVVSAADTLSNSPIQFAQGLASGVNEVALNLDALNDGFNHVGSDSEASPGINLLNSRGDVATLLPDGSMNIVFDALDHPSASPLSGNYPTGKYEPRTVVTTPGGYWVFGRDREYRAEYFLRFVDARGTHDAALPEEVSPESNPGLPSGLRSYEQGVLVASEVYDPGTHAATSLPRFFYYWSPDSAPLEVKPAELRELSPLNGVKVAINSQTRPRLLTWSDSSGQHECPLPGRLRQIGDLQLHASVLRGEPFLWISNSGFTTEVPFTLCHRAGVLTTSLSAQAIVSVDGNVIVTARDRLWLFRTFAQPPQEVPLPSTTNAWLPPIYGNTPLHVDSTTIWYSDVENSLRTVEIASGKSRRFYEHRRSFYHFVRRDGVFIQEGLEWSYVPWHGRVRHFGVLFPPHSR